MTCSRIPPALAAAAVAAALACGSAAGASRRTAVVEAVEACSPAVVNISTERIIRQSYDPFFGYRDRMFDDIFRQFREGFGAQEYRTQSLGSGVMIDPSGIIVTNEHVISRASKITVTLHDKSTCEGSLISSDADSDLAVIKVTPKGPLSAVKMGTSSDLMIGETVIAMGNPFGLAHSVSVGVLSATERSVRSEGRVVLEHLIQIDAAINPGNSGGPLININGELIGINTAIVAEAQGIGFALPIDRVKTVLASLLDSRLLKRTWTGLLLQELTPELAQQLGGNAEGALVADVEAGSPAERAGIARQDVISGADGQAITHPLDFARVMLRRNEGEKIAVSCRRDGKERTVSLKIEKMPQKSGIQLAKEKLGLDVQQISSEVARSLDVDQSIGLIVTGVEKDSPAYEAGFERGDLILRVGGRPVADLDRLAALMEQLKPGMRIQVLLYRRNSLYRGMIKVR